MAPSQPASYHYWRFWSSIGPAALANGSSARNFDTCSTKKVNLRRWDIEANMKQWNITGDPCSGAATDSTAFDNGDYSVIYSLTVNVFSSIPL